MQFNKKIAAATCVLAVAAIPAILYAYSSGPDRRKTGAPGDSTCNEAGCHTGTNLNGGSGKVEIAFPNGLQYTPGETQRWTVTVSDDTTRRAYGFQATARLESDQRTGQAGNFQPTDGSTQVICDEGDFTPRPANGCRAGFTVQFIEHTNGIRGGPNTFTFNWTAPASDAGNVHIYIAGNAANGDVTNQGDRIYTNHYVLAPAAPPTNNDRPVISQGGVGDAFNGQTGLASSAWTAIYGSKLATGARTWDPIQGNALPTSLDGVSVTINNQPATIYFISPGQINVLAPIDASTGDVQVVVTGPNGVSDPIVARKQAVLPAFYAPFGKDDKRYVTAVALDGTYVGKVGTDPRVTRAARPGETLLVFGSGFGTTNPAVATTQIVSGAPQLTAKPGIRIGETSVSFPGNGNLVSAGLYQFNITVPDTLADGDLPIIAETGGVMSPANVLLAVQR